MKILIVGANGLLGSGAVAALSDGNEIIQASRSGEVSVDLTNPESIAAMYAKVGKVDAVISATGKVPFKTLSELTLADYQSGINDKILGQVELVRQGLEYVNDGGSLTLTTGIWNAPQFQPALLLHFQTELWNLSSWLQQSKCHVACESMSLAQAF